MIYVTHLYFPLFKSHIFQVRSLLCVTWSKNLTLKNNFNSSYETFISRMINQGANMQSFGKCVFEIYGRNFAVPVVHVKVL